MYRKPWSAKQTSPIPWSLLSNANNYSSDKTDYELPLDTEHFIKTCTKSATARNKCTCHIYIFLVFRRMSGFLDVSLNSRTFGELCGKKMTQSVLVKTNLHFYHLSWTDKPPLRKTFWSLGSRPAMHCSHPRRPHCPPTWLIHILYITRAVIMTDGSWVKGSSSLDSTHVINMLSEYVSSCKQEMLECAVCLWSLCWNLKCSVDLRGAHYKRLLLYYTLSQSNEKYTSPS